MVQVKFKRKYKTEADLPEGHVLAVIPTYAKPGDAGLDITATSQTFDKYGNVSYTTGFEVEIPFGFVGLLFPRSSQSKFHLNMANCVGVIDSCFRGEMLCKFKPTLYFDLNKSSDYVFNPETFEPGDKVAQLVVVPVCEVICEEVEELSETERGAGSYGHTGR